MFICYVYLLCLFVMIICYDYCSSPQDIRSRRSFDEEIQSISSLEQLNLGTLNGLASFLQLPSLKQVFEGS
jgi:hypothetical protein